MLLHTVPTVPEREEGPEDKKKKADPVIEGTPEDLEKLFKDFKV